MSADHGLYEVTTDPEPDLGHERHFALGLDRVPSNARRGVLAGGLAERTVATYTLLAEAASRFGALDWRRRRASVSQNARHQGVGLGRDAYRGGDPDEP